MQVWNRLCKTLFVCIIQHLFLESNLCLRKLTTPSSIAPQIPQFRSLSILELQAICFVNSVANHSCSTLCDYELTYCSAKHCGSRETRGKKAYSTSQEEWHRNDLVSEGLLIIRHSIMHFVMDSWCWNEEMVAGGNAADRGYLLIFCKPTGMICTRVQDEDKEEREMGHCFLPCTDQRVLPGAQQ
uniref:Uncharacterized protein n=1 Tax=Physcomitrium patens TaxID=3218 RepID=A0A2K1LAS3_PHYPA|nr:hypothetical protein PHYPA_001538 [Physcomitrium patens]